MPSIYQHNNQKGLNSWYQKLKSFIHINYGNSQGTTSHIEEVEIPTLLLS